VSRFSQGKKIIPVTGTFLDGIAADVPSQNWSPAEWEKQFNVFREMGMDTVVIIRVGWRRRAMFPSRVMPADIVDCEDMVRVFLDQAQRTGMMLYMGVYDNSDYLLKPEWSSEIAVNLELIAELTQRYGPHPAFHGWYLSHEPSLALEPWRIWDPLAASMRKLTPEKPILLSPRYEGEKWRKVPAAPEDYAGEFNSVLSQMREHIDYAAFMDGHCGLNELGDYAACLSRAVRSHGVEFWSNLETFDRDIPIRVPPIEWTKMRYKIEAVQPYASKIITFEAAHFLSPYSMWESGRLLFARYMDYLRLCEKEK